MHTAWISTQHVGCLQHACVYWRQPSAARACWSSNSLRLLQVPLGQHKAFIDTIVVQVAASCTPHRLHPSVLVVAALCRGDTLVWYGTAFI